MYFYAFYIMLKGKLTRKIYISMSTKDNSRQIMLIIMIIVLMLAGLMIFLMRRDTDNNEAGSLDVFGQQAEARDIERKADINSIYTQLEVFYNDNGRYPSFDNMNDSAFIVDNFRGLDKEAFKDPSGNTDKLAPSPTENQYSYQPTPGCDLDCQDYRLTATMETGSYAGNYVKESLTTSGGGELLKD